MRKFTIGVAAAILAVSCAPSDNTETEYSHGDCVEDELRDLNGTCVHVEVIVEEHFSKKADVECDDFETANEVVCVHGPTGEVIARL